MVCGVSVFVCDCVSVCMGGCMFVCFCVLSVFPSISMHNSRKFLDEDIHISTSLSKCNSEDLHFNEP